MFNWKEFSKKIAFLLGEENRIGVSETKLDSLKFFNQPRLSSLLPYESYDSESKLFFNKSSVGFILKGEPLVGFTESNLKILNSFLTDNLPEDCDLQILLYASPTVAPILKKWEHARTNSAELLQKQAEYRINYLEKGIYNSLSSQSNFIIRDFKLWLSFSIPVMPSQIEEISTRLNQVRKTFLGTCQTLNLFVQDIEINDFIDQMREWLCPRLQQEPRKPAIWNCYESLSSQIVDQDHVLYIEADRLQSEFQNASEIRCLVADEFPTEWTQWHMQELIGDIFKSGLQIPCPFLISYHLHVWPRDKSVSIAQKNFINRDSKMKSQLAKFLPSLSQEHQDWHWTRQQIEEGNLLARTLFQINLYAPSNLANEYESTLRSVFDAKAWRLKKPRYFQLPIWLASMPMMMSEGLYKEFNQLKRLKTVPTNTAINLMPLQAESKGTKTPCMLLLGRRGQIAWWDPFDGSDNYNVAVAAASGAGKSVFIQDYIASRLGLNSRIWVIDVGRSYEKTCRLLGGQFIAFTLDSSISLNPFTHIKNIDESLELLKPMLALMAKPNDKTTDIENALLEQAIKSVWDNYGCNASINNVISWLEQHDEQVAKRLAQSLFSYSSEGMYGKYFKGVCNLELTNPFIVLELEELKAKKDLQRIVLLLLLYHISQEMYATERDSTTKTCIIDEAWDLFGDKNENTAHFIETGYRRARKYNGSFITITQSINDYYKNLASRAALENADTLVLLAQKAESIEQLKKSDRLTVDAHLEELLKSLRRTNDYSECVIRDKNGYAVYRLVLDSFSKILYSSKAEEFNAVKQLETEGLSLEDAILEIARRKNHEA